MLNEIRQLTSLELKSQYGINRFLHTKDQKEKKRGILLAGVWVFLAVFVAVYMAGLSYLLIELLDLSEMVVPYLVMIAALLGCLCLFSGSLCFCCLVMLQRQFSV